MVGTTLNSTPFNFDEYRNRVRQIESRGDPNAANPNSSALGLYQFMPDTWNDAAKAGVVPYYVKGQPDPRLDPNHQEAAFKWFTDNNINTLQKNNIPITPQNVYLAHQQGAQGATSLISNPDMPANRVVNRSNILLNGGTDDMTSGAFVNKWADKYNSTTGTTLNSNPMEITVNAPRKVPEAIQNIDWSSPDASKDVLRLITSDKSTSALGKIAKGAGADTGSNPENSYANKEAGPGAQIANSASYQLADQQKMTLAGQAKSMLAALLAKNALQSKGSIKGLLG